MAGSILGTRVLRREDQVLVTGHGDYVDDLRPHGRLVVRFVRSELAHARIVGIEVSAAEAVPGVVAVHTGPTLGLGTVVSRFPLDAAFDRPALATGVVRYQGEPVAVVVAENAAAAADAVAAVDVDLDPLPVVMDPEAHLAGAEAVLFPDRGSDVVMSRFPAVEGLHDDDELLVQARLVNTRMAVVPLECHAVLAEPGPGDTLVLHVSTQGAHATRDGIARSLGMDPAAVRVIAPWVGGGFGAKGGWQVEHVVAAHLARTLGRPVSWKEERFENLVSMHAREQLQHVRLGLRADGTFTSLEAVLVADAGAYPGIGGLLPGATRLMAQGTYRIPRIQVDYATVATNKAPLGAFRGAGRPQATYLLERMVDLAARRLGVDPVELRRRNLLAADEFPLTTVTGAEYDCGDYVRSLDTAVAAAGYDELRAEQDRRRASGDPIQLGIGVACYVEVTAGGGSSEYASIEVHDTGRVTLRVGTASHGQGHETTFAMIVADRLGVDLDDIEFVQSDTALVDHGGGTGGSRSAQLAGSATLQACDEVLVQARQVAARLLEASPDDIEVVDGGLAVAGVPTSRRTWSELAEAADDPLSASLDFHQGGATFPSGTHVAVVEVDTETGRVEVVRMVAVDDCGTVLNPTLVEGQQHGGLGAGIGQALYEHLVYDDDGNLLTANLATYAMPSAAELPSYETISVETPTPLNPLGAKGIGEAATIGSTPAVANAVIDALAPFGVEHLDLPHSPERVWRAIAQGRAGTLPAVDGAPWPALPQPARST